LRHLRSIAKQSSPEIDTRTLAIVQNDEVGGSNSAMPQDMPVQAFVNKVEHIRTIRAAKLAAAHRLRERQSFDGAINAGKLLDQFE
jgi:hypothetical protein